MIIKYSSMETLFSDDPDKFARIKSRFNLYVDKKFAEKERKIEDV